MTETAESIIIPEKKKCKVQNFRASTIIKAYGSVKKNKNECMQKEKKGLVQV